MALPLAAAAPPRPASGISRRTWLAPLRRPGGWLVAVGALLTIAGLVRPWLAVPLSSGWGAAQLPLVGPLPFLAVGAPALVLAVAALVWSRLPPGVVVVAGIAELAGPPLALAGLRYSNRMLVVERASSIQSLVYSTFGYRMRSTPPSNLLGMDIGPTWKLIGGLIESGLLIQLLGGVFLVVGGTRLRRADGPTPRRGSSGGLAPVLLAGALVVTPAVDVIQFERASATIARATQVQEAGTAARASALLAQARAESGAAEDTPTAIESAAATDAVAGDPSSPWSLLGAGLPGSLTGITPLQLHDLAAAATTADARVRFAAEQSLLSTAWSTLESGDIDLLPAAVRRTSVAEYLLGRIDYARQDYPDAVTALTESLAGEQDTNVVSSAWTYIALCALRVGNLAGFHTDLVRAIDHDPAALNDTARLLASGLSSEAP